MTKGVRACYEEGLDRDEEVIAAYLEEHMPAMKTLYYQYRQKGREGILKRLFQGIVRETLIDENRIRKNRQIGKWQLDLPSGKVLEVGIEKEYSLGRFEPHGDMRLIHQEQSDRIDHPVSLLNLMKDEGLIPNEVKESNFQRFSSELLNSAANYALALAGAHSRSEKIKAQAQGWQSRTLQEWVLRKAAEEETFSPLSFYEQWVIDGHTLHPGSKTKLGLEAAEVIRYSPEWGAFPEIALVAVHKSFCKATSMEGMGFTKILYQEYKDLNRYVTTFLQEVGADAKDYELIPVHPWQLEHTLPKLYRESIQKQEIIWIRGYGIPAAALVSFRSLAPLQKKGEGRHHIKTAINVQTTSAIRTVSPQSTENGPLLSPILRDIQKREKWFGHRFVMLEERAGIYFSAPSQGRTEEERTWLGKNLASILRENPENHVKTGEIPMPGAALINRSPISGIPIIVELVEEHGRNFQIPEVGQAAASFIRHYAEMCLPGFLTMMSKYGMSLEGHLQNSVPVFRNGLPVRMIIRDYGGIRISRKRLEKQAVSCSLSPQSPIVTEDLADVRNVLSHAVFQNHIGELIISLASWLGIEESRLWEPVAAVCWNQFEEMKKDPVIEKQAKEDQEFLFQPVMGLKALVTMRLFDDIAANSYTMVENPLFKWAEEQIIQQGRK